LLCLHQSGARHLGSLPAAAMLAIAAAGNAGQGKQIRAQEHQG